jgi:putative flippase GtrA
MTDLAASLALRTRVASHTRRLTKFGVVGLSGLAVNTVALWGLAGILGLHYLLGVIVATQASTLWNFGLSEHWVFADRSQSGGWLRRFGLFWGMNNAALLVRGPLVVLLTSVFDAHYLVSNFTSLGLVMLARYTFSDQWVWRHEVALNEV